MRRPRREGRDRARRFSPGLAARIACYDGRRWFVKAASGLRADNTLMTGDGVVIAGWPHACRGAAFADMVLLAPSVAMQGGPEPADLPARSPAGRPASPAGVTATVCALAGYFTERSLRPPPPGLPTVRAFQAAQGEITRRWLAQLL
jgi:hypothetical protein